MYPNMFKNMDDFFPKVTSIYSNTNIQPSYYDQIMDQNLVDVIESMGQIQLTKLKETYGIGHVVNKLKLKDIIECVLWGTTKDLHQIMWFLRSSNKLVRFDSYWVRWYLNSNRYPDINSKILQLKQDKLYESNLAFCGEVNQLYRNETNHILEKEKLDITKAKMHFPTIEYEEIKGFGLAIALNNNILKSRYLHRIRDKASMVFKDLSLIQYINHNSTTEASIKQLNLLEAYRTLTGKPSDDLKRLLRFDESNSFSLVKIKDVHLDKPFNQTTFHDIFEEIVKTDKLMDRYIDRSIGHLAASLDKNWLEFIRGKAINGLSNISTHHRDFFLRIINGDGDGIMGTMENNYFNKWFKFTNKKKFMFLTSRDLESQKSWTKSSVEERARKHYWSFSLSQLHKVGLLGSPTGPGTMDDLFESLLSTDELYKVLGGPVVKYMERVTQQMFSDMEMDIEKPMKDHIPLLKSRGSICKSRLLSCAKTHGEIFIFPYKSS